MKWKPLPIVLMLMMGAGMPCRGEASPWPQGIQQVLDHTPWLTFSRGNTLPLYLWPARNPGTLDRAVLIKLLTELDRRGIGLVSSWFPNQVEASLETALPVARLQKELGLMVNIDATSMLYSFFDGSEETAHLDATGKPFFDDTFGSANMGCPFRLEQRIAPMKARLQAVIDVYKKEALPVDFVFADWEVDGPIEWNESWKASQRCTVCLEHLKGAPFEGYQQALRAIRSRLQRVVYAEPMRAAFPKTLVGNYAVYPHDGYRYWYDYFEKYVEGQPARMEGHARYRPWAHEFEDTGYTFAMPVVYPWSWTWNWYDFEQGDYRWFYNGLLVASNAGKHTPAETPIISFVHYHTVDVGLSERLAGPPEKAGKARQMSEFAYRELLWHLLLRGTDTFFLWCTEEENVKEIELLFPVYAASRQFGPFWEKGTPITFEVPKEPGTVISGLRLDRSVLIRRTDFTGNAGPVSIVIEGQEVAVPAHPGETQIITLK
ncbi:MAG: hypothetical protein HYV27_02100 [Candidatus Hydrogenedentes bacterium]|nr:hypothetical protein [Candidatus Hydrogenedentota bacterium]